MKILILGAAGMVGQKLAQKIASEGLGEAAISSLMLFDMVAAKIPKADFPIENLVGNFSATEMSTKLAALKPDIIFHLASIVSGEAEMNFTKGYEVNLRATWNLLEALRIEHEKDLSYRPRLIFASSIAVFGGPFPDKIFDDFLTAPQTSYGAQKAAIELLVADYSRKGFIDGFSMRIPTVCVRPGKANLAASSFFSGIIREPLNGIEAILPVADTVRHWHASPRSAAGFFTHAATLDIGKLGGRLSLNLPGLSCTVAEQIEALRKFAGEDIIELIQPKPDEAIMKIVDGWPRNFDPQRAIDLGFRSEATFDEIIQVYVEDELS